MDKRVKDAVMTVILWKNERQNKGVYAVNCPSWASLLLFREGIGVGNNKITKSGNVIATWKDRYSSRKTNGCYNLLKPQIEWVK